jgi:hypothetical protein
MPVEYDMNKKGALAPRIDVLTYWHHTNGCRTTLPGVPELFVHAGDEEAEPRPALGGDRRRGAGEHHPGEELRPNV